MYISVRDFMILVLLNFLYLALILRIRGHKIIIQGFNFFIIEL